MERLWINVSQVEKESYRIAEICLERCYAGAPLNTNNHFERPAILSVFTPIARADDMNGATKMPAFRWDCLILCLLASLFSYTNAPIAFAQDDLDDATEEERKQN